jgi:hypothetical protein
MVRELIAGQADAGIDFPGQLAGGTIGQDNLVVPADHEHGIRHRIDDRLQEGPRLPHRLVLSLQLPLGLAQISVLDFQFDLMDFELGNEALHLVWPGRLRVAYVVVEEFTWSLARTRIARQLGTAGVGHEKLRLEAKDSGENAKTILYRALRERK